MAPLCMHKISSVLYSVTAACLLVRSTGFANVVHLRTGIQSSNMRGLFPQVSCHEPNILYMTDIKQLSRGKHAAVQPAKAWRPDCHVWYLPPWTESYLICVFWLYKESASACQSMVNKLPCAALAWDICLGRRHAPETIAMQRLVLLSHTGPSEGLWVMWMSFPLVFFFSLWRRRIRFPIAPALKPLLHSCAATPPTLIPPPTLNEKGRHGESEPSTAGRGAGGSAPTNSIKDIKQDIAPWSAVWHRTVARLEGSRTGRGFIIFVQVHAQGTGNTVGISQRACCFIFQFGARAKWELELVNGECLAFQTWFFFFLPPATFLVKKNNSKIK